MGGAIVVGGIGYRLAANALGTDFDIYPACLAAAGIPLPQDRIVDGQNLLPVLKGETLSLRDTLYCYKGKRLVGVHHQNWKYLRRHLTDNGGYASLSQGPFLFNLDTDPNESYDLVESEPEIAASLVDMLESWDTEMQKNVRGWL